MVSQDNNMQESELLQENAAKAAEECTSNDETQQTDKEAEATDEVTDLQQQFDELKEAHLRLMAEYDNFRKRTLKEKSDLIKSGGERVLQAFVMVMDDLDLALNNLNSATNMEGIKEGINLIHSKFEHTLKTQGVIEMPTVGEEFDPDKYEAVAMVPATDPAQKGKILDCIQKGYTLHDKVLRHPKVVVAN